MSAESVRIEVGDGQDRKRGIGFRDRGEDRVSVPVPVVRPSEVPSPIGQNRQLERIDEAVLVRPGEDAPFEANPDRTVAVDPTLVQAVLDRLSDEQIGGTEVRSAQRIGHVARGQNAGTVSQEVPGSVCTRSGRVPLEFRGRVHGEAPRRSCRGVGRRSSGLLDSVFALLGVLHRKHFMMSPLTCVVIRTWEPPCRTASQPRRRSDARSHRRSDGQTV